MENTIKPLNKKLRKELYRKARKNIADDIGDQFLCGQFHDLLKELFGYEYQMCDVIYLLPEFGLFKPTKEEAKEYSTGVCWFRIHAENDYVQFERLVCLDMCLELL